jgi:hypothetical protein
VRGDSTTVRHGVANHDPHAHRISVPTSAPTHDSRHAAIAIHLSQELVHVHDLRLDLDHQQSATTRAVSKHVDDAALAIPANVTSGANSHPGNEVSNCAICSWIAE